MLWGKVESFASFQKIQAKITEYAEHGMLDIYVSFNKWIKAVHKGCIHTKDQEILLLHTDPKNFFPWKHLDSYNPQNLSVNSFNIQSMKVKDHKILL